MKPIVIDDLLGNLGMNRQLLIKKNPKYQEEFAKLDKYYERYEQSPSDSLLRATNNLSVAFMEKIKKENPEMFSVDVEEEVEIKVDDKLSNVKKALDFYIDEGDQDAMDDLFNQAGEKTSKLLLTYEDFKVFNKAIRSKNVLIISHFFDLLERLKIFKEGILARDKEFIKLILAGKNLQLIKQMFDLSEKNGISADVIGSEEFVMAIFELNDEELIKRTLVAIKGHKYAPYIIKKLSKKYDLDAYGVTDEETVKKVKASKAAPDNVDEIVEMLASGLITMDLPLVTKLERKFAIKVLDSSDDIATGGDTYKFVVPTNVAKYFDAKVLSKDTDYTIFQAEKTNFERYFGTSIYELGICWFNMINLISIQDMLAIFYVANISTSLMVDRSNKSLRAEYIEKLKFVIQNPESNKIAGQYFTMKEANLINLRKSGFLDEQYCPTKLLYCAVVLHSFPFPAYTHPFEYIAIKDINSMFQFQTVRGEYGNEAFYTDGDVLFHNFTDLTINKFATALTDISRTTILNLKSTGRSDIKKQNSVINHFIPFIYSVPKSGVTIPTFTLRMLDVPDRKINWGIYELQGINDKVYINSYALSNVIMGLNKKDYNLMTYRGTLSDSIFASPQEGVIVNYDKTYLAIRGIRGNEFLSANFGSNYEKYYEEMFEKNHLSKELLDKLDPDMVKEIYSSANILIDSTETGLQYKSEKQYSPTFEKQVVKPAPQVKKVTVAVPKKDDRVYVNLDFAKKNLDRELISVFEKVQNLRGEQRDEAILDEMYTNGIDRVFPRQLLYLGFGLKEWIKDKPERINFKNKYKLTIPVLLSMAPTYYLEKI